MAPLHIYGRNPKGGTFPKGVSSTIHKAHPFFVLCFFFTSEAAIVARCASAASTSTQTPTISARTGMDTCAKSGDAQISPVLAPLATTNGSPPSQRSPYPHLPELCHLPRRSSQMRSFYAVVCFWGATRYLVVLTQQREPVWRVASKQSPPMDNREKLKSPRQEQSLQAGVGVAYLIGDFMASAPFGRRRGFGGLKRGTMQAGSPGILGRVGGLPGLGFTEISQ